MACLQSSNMPTPASSHLFLSPLSSPSLAIHSAATSLGEVFSLYVAFPITTQQNNEFGHFLKLSRAVQLKENSLHERT